MLDFACRGDDPAAGPVAGTGQPGIGCYHLDRRLRFEAADAAAVRMLGVAEADLLGRGLSEAFPALSGGAVERRCRAILGGAGPQQFLFHFAPTERWYVVTAEPVGPRGRPASVAVRFTDVTDPPDGVAARIRAERLDAAAQATGRLAHDFNNLLTVVLGNAEYLEEALSDDPDLAEAVRLVMQAAERGEALTRRLLQFARRPAARTEQAETGEVLARLAERLRADWPGHRITVSSADAAPGVLAGAAELEAALRELAANGLEAMPEGGALHLSVGGTACGERVRVTVADTGRGMDAALLRRCAEPFVTTRAEHWGVGLGLSAAFGFAASHGGTLHLESRPGGGTRATLELPAAPSPRAVPSGAIPPGAGAAGSGHVLLVDDDPVGRAAVARLLGTLGYGVTAVSSAAEALAALEDDPPPSLLLADVVLPGGPDGARLVSEARRRRPDLPVLLMSGYAADPSGAEMRQDGVRLLPKPFRRASLAEALRGELGLNL